MIYQNMIYYVAEMGFHSIFTLPFMFFQINKLFYKCPILISYY